MIDIIIAVDFDGTLCEHKFPDIGEIKATHEKIIDFIRNSKKYGDKIILWTCREDLPERKYLTEAVEWCKDHKIPIDHVNENPEDIFYGDSQRKLYADVYIDDKAVNVKDF